MGLTNQHTACPVLLIPPPRLIFTLREYPSTEDFVYLRRFTRWPASANPYALQVVQFADAPPSNYFTMSVRGITHYVDGANAEFASEVAGCGRRLAGARLRGLAHALRWLTCCLACLEHICLSTHTHTQPWKTLSRR